jgi:hypothetical protein
MRRWLGPCLGCIIMSLIIVQHKRNGEALSHFHMQQSDITISAPVVVDMQAVLF